jgi:hypothetical protein
MSETRFRSGILVFPDLTQLDLTGPYEALARLPGAETLLLWKILDPVRSEHGLTILPTTAPPFASGSPETADPVVLAGVLARAQPRQRARAERVARAAAALR